MNYLSQRDKDNKMIFGAGETEYSINHTFQPEPKKRQRKPWVYQDRYDSLFEKYKWVALLALVGWTGFLSMIVAYYFK